MLVKPKDNKSKISLTQMCITLIKGLPQHCSGLMVILEINSCGKKNKKINAI